MSDKSAWSGWLASGAAGAIIGGVVTSGFNYLNHQSDVDAKMIELSVGVLRSQPTPETQPLREWAVGEIQKRAGFIFTAEQRSTLLKEELPFKGGYWSGGIGGGIGTGPATVPKTDNSTVPGSKP